MTVKNKLILCMALLLTTTIAVVSLVGFINFRQSSIDGYSDKLQNQSFLVSKAVEQRVNRYFDAMNIVSKNVPFDEYGELEVDKTMVFIYQLKKDLNVLNAYIGMKDGRTYADSDRGLIPGFNAKDLEREWYLRIFANEKRIITKPYKSSVGDFVMAIGIPVIRDGQVVAALCINLALDTLTDFISQISEGNYIYASRSDGFVLASNNPDDIGENLFTINPSFEAHKGASVSQHNFTKNGENLFVVSAQIESSKWNVWAWDTQENILSSSKSNLIFSSIIATVMIIISLIVTYFLVVRLMYLPIGGEPKYIEKLLKDVSQGNLTTCPEATGKETGVYAEIKSMVSGLKAIIKEINDSADKLRYSVVDMSNSTQEVSSSSTAQMIQLEQAATAMNEMALTVQEVAQNAVQAAGAADKSHMNAEQGYSIVKDMNDSIGVLVNGIEEVVVVTNNLEKETNNISSILDVINGISEQTNLLALNAAIEAARAGEQGRGFAVVADEVRNLANRTKESTNEIQKMIVNLQDEAKQSVNLMNINVQDAQKTKERSEDASQSLYSIQESVNVIQEMNAQIATAAEEQTQVAAEINQSVVTINDLAKSTNQSTENNNRIAQSITGISESLEESVVIFKI